MLPFGPNTGSLRVLAIGAHADDIEIGAGGTVLSLVAAGALERLDFLVLTADGVRRNEAIESAEHCLSRVDGEVVVEDLPERHFHTVATDVKVAVAAAVARSQPQVVIGPALHDVHQDHRATAEAIQQACRDHVVLQYEIVKFEGDLRTPNVYVPLDAATIDDKIAWLHKAFPSQLGRQWFDDETFRGLARIRGVECVAQYAEGFHCRKMVLGPRLER